MMDQVERLRIEELKIEHIKFDRAKQMQNWLTGHAEVYTVGSEVVRGLYYGAYNGIFAIFSSQEAIRLPIKNVPELARWLVNDVADEVMGIYEDIHDLGIARRPSPGAG